MAQPAAGSEGRSGGTRSSSSGEGNGEATVVTTAAARARREDFEALAFDHLDAAYRFALRFTRDETNAEDLVQESFLRAYRFFHRFQPGTNFKAWLFRLLQNTFINDYRKRKARPPTVDFEKVEAVYDGCRDAILGRPVGHPAEVLDATLLREDIAPVPQARDGWIRLRIVRKSSSFAPTFTSTSPGR